MQKYLEASQYIDCCHTEIIKQAALLAADSSDRDAIAQRCFEFVRDHIKHSGDYKMNPVTCKASDVLKYGTGYCYAKSHLLAALLRANNIPAGLCYQRLTISNDTSPFCLHGLNAIQLQNGSWYRVDARGNKAGVDAQFTPPKEQLAFPIISNGEADLPEIWNRPLNVIVEALTSHKTYRDVARNLPDIELF